MLTNVLLPASYCPRDLIPRICHTGETAINRGLAKRLEQMAKERERRERAAAAADEEFSAEFLNAAREVRSPCPIKPRPRACVCVAFGVMSCVTRP